MSLGNNLRPRQINDYLKIEHTGTAFGETRYRIKWAYQDVQKLYLKGNERDIYYDSDAAPQPRRLLSKPSNRERFLPCKIDLQPPPMTQLYCSLEKGSEGNSGTLGKRQTKIRCEFQGFRRTTNAAPMI